MPGHAVTARPLVTANQVTVARLLPMPLVAWLIYRGAAAGGDLPAWWVPALILATVIGATDYVDGYLARKQGPTVLGGLLDPIADKVFIALVYLPLGDLGYLPLWLVGLMFVREFLVTAMRSAYAYRGVSFATSYLGKMKTWVQMQGLGLLVLVHLVDHRTMFWLLVLQIVGPAIAVALIWLKRRTIWKSGVATMFFIGVLTALHLTTNVRWTITGSVATICALTWVSGFDYLVGGLAKLRAASPWSRRDGVRLVGGLALPVAGTLALGWSPAPALPLLSLIALELAVGGLDNLLAVHRVLDGARWWGIRTWGASALAASALLATPLGIAELAWLGPWAALALSAAGVSRAFWRGRQYYLT